jgi:hypothetical protein
MPYKNYKFAFLKHHKREVYKLSNNHSIIVFCL